MFKVPRLRLNSIYRILAMMAGCCALAAVAVASRADTLDDFIIAGMQKAHITGLSLAVVQHGEIIKAKGYGFTDEATNTPVTPATLFQAGSISKSVSAFGVMHLVQEAKLSLDADINTELRSWKLPENEFTKDQKSRYGAFSVTPPV